MPKNKPLMGHVDVSVGVVIFGICRSVLNSVRHVEQFKSALKGGRLAKETHYRFAIRRRCLRM